jgi:hypothetical protein
VNHHGEYFCDDYEYSLFLKTMMIYLQALVDQISKDTQSETFKKVISDDGNRFAEKNLKELNA